MDDEDNSNNDVSIRTERQIMEEILDLYKDLPCLWDVSNELYKNKQARLNALEILLTKWKTINKNITLESVKKKIENMRTTFFREQKKVEASKSTGAAAADVYKPALWYYDQLMFLIENQEAKRDGVDSIVSFGSENSESEKKSKKIKKHCLTDAQSKQLRLLESAEQLLSSQEDATESIARAMALQLKEMSKLQRCIAEKLISEIMFYGKLDQLTVNSSISLRANYIASPPVNNYNIQPRREIYVPMVSPASECRYTPSPSSHSLPSQSPSQSPASYTHRHSPGTQISRKVIPRQVYNNNVDSCNPVVLSIPESNSQAPPTQDYVNIIEVPLQPFNMPTGNQAFSPPQSSDMPTENQAFSPPQSSDMPTENQTFYPQPNTVYEGDSSLLSDFLILNK